MRAVWKLDHRKPRTAPKGTKNTTVRRAEGKVICDDLRKEKLKHVKEKSPDGTKEKKNVKELDNTEK